MAHHSRYDLDQRRRNNEYQDSWHEKQMRPPTADEIEEFNAIHDIMRMRLDAAIRADEDKEP